MQFFDISTDWSIVWKNQNVFIEKIRKSVILISISKDFSIWSTLDFLSLSALMGFRISTIFRNEYLITNDFSIRLSIWTVFRFPIIFRYERFFIQFPKILRYEMFDFQYIARFSICQRCRCSILKFRNRTALHKTFGSN